jgi:predicted alpha/beta-hydrolase family hydrolase
MFNGPDDADRTLVLAHGAGAPMDSAFMEAFAVGIAGRGVRVVRFEFPYMAGRREGKRRPPDREAVLLDTWREVYGAVAAGGTTFIGGKSMGGRMASMVADDLGVPGLVCLGYPFHAPGRPDKPRVAHLEHMATRALIVQGTRDPFGPTADVATYALSSRITVHWLVDGDHDLVPRKASGRGRDENWAEAIDTVARFVLG